MKARVLAKLAQVGTVFRVRARHGVWPEIKCIMGYGS